MYVMHSHLKALSVAILTSYRESETSSYTNTRR